MSLLLKSIVAVWQCLLAFTVFVAFGYVEKISERGYVVIILLWLYLASSQLFFSTFLLGLYYYFTKNGLLEYRFMVFLTMLVLLSISPSGENDDAKVNFKKYEEEIRQLYLRYNPEMLPKVDGILVKYRGRERELIQQLRQKYGA
jgi:hypothetical protein